MVEGWWIVRGEKKKPSSTFQCPVEEAQLNIHQTMVGSGRSCLWSFLGGFWSCRGKVSTTGIVSAARFQRCKFRLIHVSIHRFSLVKASSWLLSSLIFHGLPQKGVLVVVWCFCQEVMVEVWSIVRGWKK